MKLKRLRSQMNLEQGRWHADKLTSTFGAVAASDERAKAVWAATMGLKAKVDEEWGKLVDAS